MKTTVKLHPILTAHTHEATAVVTQVHTVAYMMRKCNCMCMVHVNYCVIV